MHSTFDLRRRRVLARRSVVPAECFEYRLMMSAQSLSDPGSNNPGGHENSAVEPTESSSLVRLTAGEFRIDSDGRLLSAETNQPVFWKSISGTGVWPATNSIFDRPTPGQPVVIPPGMVLPGRPTTEILFQGKFPSQDTGFKAQRLVGDFALQAAGRPATGWTLLNDLDSNILDYQHGDRILITGLQEDGSPPEMNSFAVGASTTVGEVLSKIQTAFSGTIAELDNEGRIVVTAANPGTSFLAISLFDAPTNSGRTEFEPYKLFIEQPGKNPDRYFLTVETLDPEGEALRIQFEITRVEERSWQITAEISADRGKVVSDIIGPVIFSDDGTFSHVASENGMAELVVRLNGQHELQRIQLTFQPSEDSEGLIELPGSFSLGLRPDGHPPGYLADFDIDSGGEMDLLFSNGIGFPAGLVELNRESRLVHESVNDSDAAFSNGQSPPAPPNFVIGSPTSTIFPSRNSLIYLRTNEGSRTQSRIRKADVDDWRDTLVLRSPSFFDFAAPQDQPQQESFLDADLDRLFWTLRTVPTLAVDAERFGSAPEERATRPVGNDSTSQITLFDKNDAGTWPPELQKTPDDQFVDSQLGEK